MGSDDVKKIVEMTHDIMRNYTKSKGIAVDFTMGNGYDTLFLAQQDFAKVIAFDIQEESLMRTKALLQKEKQLAKVNLICDGHENLDAYVSAFDVGIFNFGYLPGGSHELSTKPQTSICAIEKGLSLLKKEGMMSLCIYSGGDSGFTERDALLAYLKTLDSKRYLVILSSYYNRPNNPPIPVMIVKK